MRQVVMESHFESLHRAQLQAIGFPPALVFRLLSKLSTGSAENIEGSFQLCLDEKGSLSACGSVLKCSRPLPALSDVFVLQHIWESDGGAGAKGELLTDPGLLAKVESALGIVRREGEEVGEVMEGMVRIVCEQSGKSKMVAWKALRESGFDLIAGIALSRQLTEEDVLRGKRERLALTMDEFRRGLDGICGEKTADNVPEAQIQAMYEDWKDRKSREPMRDSENWVHCSGYQWREEEDKIITVAIPLPPNMKKKDISSDITSRQWKFGVRGEKRIIDGEFFGHVVPDECFWTMEEGCVSVSVQMCEGGWGELIVGEVQGEEGGKVEEEMVVMLRVDEVMTRMWHVNQTYTAVTHEDKQRPVWYLMEPHGLALTHSRTPNFACHPFANALTGHVVSVLWPVSDVRAGDRCSRDYVPPIFPGETQSSRNLRERLIMAHYENNGIFPAHIPLPLPLTTHPPPPSHPPPSTHAAPVKLCVLTSGAKQSTELSWECPEGYRVCASPEQADLILGYYEMLPSALLKAASYTFCRLDGDHILVHKTCFCRLVRGRDYCVQGVDVRSEVGLLLSPTAMALTKGVVGSWYLVAPDGPWSAVPHRITNHQVEIVRLSEVGTAVATQFLQRTVLHKGHCCCLQYSVVVLADKGGTLSAYLHPLPRVRLASRTCGETGFQPWDTPALITSGSCHVEWGEYLSSLMATYKTEWSPQCQSSVTQAISALFGLALPQCKGSAAVYTVDVLLLHRTQLVPVIIGVDPVPSFASSTIAKDCLDWLLARSPSDKFVSL